MFARITETLKETYSEDFAVYRLFFEERDPDQGGVCWQFQRALGADGLWLSLGEEDQGVCVVKEPQAFVAYDCLVSACLDAQHLACRFDQAATQQLGFDGLEIYFQLEQAQWHQVQQWYALIFQPLTAPDTRPTPT